MKKAILLAIMLNSISLQILSSDSGAGFTAAVLFGLVYVTCKSYVVGHETKHFVAHEKEQNISNAHITTSCSNQASVEEDQVRISPVNCSQEQQLNSSIIRLNYENFPFGGAIRTRLAPLSPATSPLSSLVSVKTDDNVSHVSPNKFPSPNSAFSCAIEKNGKQGEASARSVATAKHDENKNSVGSHLGDSYYNLGVIADDKGKGIVGSGYYNAKLGCMVGTELINQLNE